MAAIPSNRRIREAQTKGIGGAVLIEGSFTPTLSASGLTFTYTTQRGFVRRIGSLVFVNIRIVFSASGTPGGGGLSVNGLPNPGLVNELQRLPVLQMQNSGYSNDEVNRLAFEINGNVSNGTLIFKNSALAPLTTYSNCVLLIQGSYISTL